MSDNNEIDITKSVNQVNGQYFIPKERADRLGLKNGDNIIIKLGGWFNKVRGYVAETMPKSDEFHVIRYKSHEELSEDLTEEINYSKRLMGLNEGLNLVKKRNKDLIDDKA